MSIPNCKVGPTETRFKQFSLYMYTYEKFHFYILYSSLELTCIKMNYVMVTKLVFTYHCIFPRSSFNKEEVLFR
jgi:hypothetical protein